MSPNKFLVALSALICAMSPVMADPLVKPGDIVAICGDSITQQKRYSVYIEDYLLMCQPAPNVHAVQFGSNGAAAYVLGSRINDLALFHPTVATTLYGMNDGQYKPLNDERAIAYRKGLNGSLDALKGIGVRDVLIASPDTVDWLGKADGTKMYNDTLAGFGAICKEIATARNLAFTDNHAIMADAFANVHADAPAGVQVSWFDTHPEPSGHLVIAYSFLKGLGFDGNIGTIMWDLDKERASGSEGQKIVSVQGGKVDIESSRYPFCFTGDPTKVGPDTANMLRELPFNQDLNRYILIVHGIKTPNAKITWGKQSRVVSATALDKGINLAALFVPNNPFSAQFAKVDEAVRTKQAAETTLTWAFLSQLWQLKRAVPGQEALLAQIAKGGLDEDARLTKAASDLVVPVRHTINVEPAP